MNQVKAIRVGLIAICIAMASLGLAQTSRTRTSGSNQIIPLTTAAPRYSGSNGNSIRGAQTGASAESVINIGANANAATHPATNASVLPRIQATEITRAVAGNSGSTGNLGSATQTGTSAATATNTTAKAEIGTAPNTRTFVDTAEPGATPALIIFAATSSPSPTPSPSVSPTPTPTP